MRYVSCDYTQAVITTLLYVTQYHLPSLVGRVTVYLDMADALSTIRITFHPRCLSSEF